MRTLGTIIGRILKVVLGLVIIKLFVDIIADAVVSKMNKKGE